MRSNCMGRGRSSVASIVDKLVWQTIVVSIRVARTSLVRIRLTYSASIPTISRRNRILHILQNDGVCPCRPSFLLPLKGLGTRLSFPSLLVHIPGSHSQCCFYLATWHRNFMVFFQPVREHAEREIEHEHPSVWKENSEIPIAECRHPNFILPNSHPW